MSTEIQIWHASSSIDGSGPIESICECCLDDQERQRANRLRRDTSRNQHVIGRGMAKQLLAHRSGVEPSAIEIELEPHGKPVVRSPAQAICPFNVAHTDGLVLCGMTTNAAAPSAGNAERRLPKLGVDVENLGRRTDTAIANRFFSEPEVAFLNQFQTEADRKHMFLRIWTLKESFIKAIGTGLSTPLADFAFVEIDSPRPQICLLSDKLDHGDRWYFEVFEPRPGYIGAIAYSSLDQLETPRILMRSFDDHVANMIRRN